MTPRWLHRIFGRTYRRGQIDFDPTRFIPRQTQRLFDNLADIMSLSLGWTVSCATGARSRALSKKLFLRQITGNVSQKRETLDGCLQVAIQVQFKRITQSISSEWRNLDSAPFRAALKKTHVYADSAARIAPTKTRLDAEDTIGAYKPKAQSFASRSWPLTKTTSASRIASN